MQKRSLQAQLRTTNIVQHCAIKLAKLHQDPLLYTLSKRRIFLKFTIFSFGACLQLSILANCSLPSACHPPSFHSSFLDPLRVLVCAAGKNLELRLCNLQDITILSSEKHIQLLHLVPQVLNIILSFTPLMFLPSVCGNWSFPPHSSGSSFHIFPPF